MEHILQFGINIDDEAIIEAVKNKASQKAIEQISQDINSYTRGYSTKLDALFNEQIKQCIEDNKDVIIEKAIDHLTANLSHTKIVKEKLKVVMEEYNDED